MRGEDRLPADPDRSKSLSRYFVRTRCVEMSKIGIVYQWWNVEREIWNTAVDQWAIMTVLNNILFSILEVQKRLSSNLVKLQPQNRLQAIKLARSLAKLIISKDCIRKFAKD